MNETKELRRMSRQELIEIIYEQKKIEEELRSQMKVMQEELDNRNLCIAESGSIAEAAMKLSGIFEAAQKAADLYVSSVKAKTGAEDETGDEKDTAAKANEDA